MFVFVFSRFMRLLILSILGITPVVFGSLRTPKGGVSSTKIGPMQTRGKLSSEDLSRLLNIISNLREGFSAKDIKNVIMYVLGIPEEEAFAFMRLAIPLETYVDDGGSSHASPRPEEFDAKEGATAHSPISGGY